MAKKKVEPNGAANGSNPVVKTVRTVLLTTAGALALGKEEIETIVSQLVEKGEIAEKDGRELLADLVNRPRKEMGKAEEKFEGFFDRRIESVLHRMNVPSKTDVEGLSRKIGSLTQMVDELNTKIAK